MRIRTRYVAVEMDDRIQERLAYASDQLRTTVTGYMRSAADDVADTGTRLSALCDRAANRVNVVMAALTSKVAPSVDRQQEVARPRPGSVDRQRRHSD